MSERVAGCGMGCGASLGVRRVTVGRLGGAGIRPKRLGGMGYIQKGRGGLSWCVRVAIKVVGQRWASREGAGKGGHVWGGQRRIEDTWGTSMGRGA